MTGFIREPMNGFIREPMSRAELDSGYRHTTSTMNAASKEGR